jgi:hypothetical protein
MYGGGKGIADSALPYKRTARCVATRGRERRRGVAARAAGALPLAAASTRRRVAASAPSRPRPLLARGCVHGLDLLCLPPCVFIFLARPARSSWLKSTAKDCEEQVKKFAKKGMMPSQIGIVLRDSHGIAQVRSRAGWAGAAAH